MGLCSLWRIGRLVTPTTHVVTLSQGSCPHSCVRGSEISNGETKPSVNTTSSVCPQLWVGSKICVGPNCSVGLHLKWFSFFFFLFTSTVCNHASWFSFAMFVNQLCVIYVLNKQQYYLNGCTTLICFHSSLPRPWFVFHFLVSVCFMAQICFYATNVFDA